MDKLILTEKNQLSAVAITSQNVHAYDGQIKICEIPSYSENEKKELLQKLCSLLRNNESKSMACKIMENPSAYDELNKVNISDLLTTVLKCENLTSDVFLLLEEQLSDNYNLGQCLQGTSIRLFSILNLLKN